MHKLKVLICDDMEHVRNSHENYLFQTGKSASIFHPLTELSESAEKAITLTREAITDGSPFDLCLMDVDFSKGSGASGPGLSSGMDGFSAANEIHLLSPSTVIVMISAYSTDDNHALAEKSPWIEKFLRRGSFSKQEFSEVCTFALLRKLHAEGRLLSEKETLHTKSPVMLDYLKAVDRITPEQPVVIYGETGTGKELTAKRINVNARMATGKEFRPLVTINCGGIADSLKNSEIFGHVRGAFTGANQDRKGLLEQADGGDVFLDELQNAPEDLQKLLIRVLEYQEFTPLGGNKPKRIHVRFIAAMNRSPSESRMSGTLLPDLLARLQKGYLIIPPLRERHGDIRALIEHFKRASGQADKTFSPEAISFLETQQWPTNIRGLETVVSDAIRNSKIPMISVEALKRIPILREMSDEIAHAAANMKNAVEQSSPSTSPFEAQIENLVTTWLQTDACLSDVTRDFEKSALNRLWKSDPTPARIARRTKMPESTIRRKLAEYKII